MNARRTAAALLTFLVLGLALVACGADTPPGEKVPDLAAQLERVDAAVANEDHKAARSAVQDLVAATAAAELAEQITDEEADRIVAAARQVLANLVTTDQKGSEKDGEKAGPEDD